MAKTATKPAQSAPEQVNLPIGRRDASVDAATLDKEQRTFEVVWTKGADVKRGFYETWIEQLEVTPEAVRLDRFNSGRAPVLDTHSSWELKNIIGVIEKAWIKDGEGRAKIRLSSREDISGIVSDIADGIIGNISCGYIVHSVVEETKDGVRYRRATDWEPVEISFVPVPADPDAGMRSATQGAVYPCIIKRALPEEPTMERNTPASGEQPAANPTPAMLPDPKQDRAQATPQPAPVQAPATETRAHSWAASDIQKVTARASAFGLSSDAALEILADANVRTIDEATDALQTRAAKGNAPRQRPQSQIIRDEGDTIRTAVESAILLRANPRALKDDAPEREMARSYRGLSLLELGKSFIEDTQGVRLRGLSRMEQATVCLGLDTRGGMHSTSDFANLLSNVVGKRLRDTYKQTVQTWRPFCRQNNAPDFKERAIVQLTGMPEFKQVREGQEYQYASLGDAVEKYAIGTFGRIIAITRQTLINDDLGAFDRLPTLFGRAAAEFESDTVWGILIDNPDMSDGNPLFHADYGNLAGSGADPSETTLEAAEIALGAQTDAAGKPLNLQAKFLAVSRKHKVKAQKLLTSVQAAKSGDVNVYQNSMDLIVEDRLYKAGAGDISPWLTIADPAQWDTIEYAYLEGEEGLYTEQRIGFTVDGVEVKGRLDFGAKAIDRKGFQKNPGN